MLLDPWLPTPLVDVMSVVVPFYRQNHPDKLCAKLEFQFFECVEAYGVHKSKEKCRALFYDMFECQKGILQKQRVAAIRKERERQYKAGLLKEPFSEHPPIDSYLYV